MHRSGTSWLAGALQSAGLYAGEVVERGTHTRKGNRENLEIRALNDEVLASSDGAWDAPPESLIWTDEEARHRDDLVHRFSTESAVWTFKDPRSLLTLGFWEGAEADIVRVGVFREPGRVAASLAARDGMRTARALRLWRAYNRILLDLYDAGTFPLVHFDGDPDGMAAQLRAVIDLVGEAIDNRVELSPAEAAEFLDPELIRAVDATPEFVASAPEAERSRVARLIEDTDRLYGSLRERSLDA
jgi:hypothetical protein